MKLKVFLGFVLVLFLLAACSQPVQPRAELESESASALKTDYTETQFDLTQTDYAMVVFADAPAASYKGGVANLKATQPQGRAKLDVNSPAVKAYVRHLENEHADFRSFLRRNAPKAEIVGGNVLVLNSVTVKLNGASLQSLARGPKVKAVEYSTLYRPTMNKSTGLISADTFWQTTGYRGAGVKVGIIDAGIDESHVFFACKKGIQHEVFASGKAGDTSNLIVSDHGTHVSGTVAGCVLSEADEAKYIGVELEGSMSGVAPDATLYDYNVFPGFGSGYVAFGGSAFSHDIANALEAAVADGMDVVNMSLGGSVQGPHDFLAEATNATVDAGVVVAVSAGNSGPDNYTIGSPGSAEKAITVGASTNSHLIGVPVEVDFDGDGTADASYQSAVGDFDPFADRIASGNLLVWAGDYGDVFACTALQPVPADSVVLISRGGCTFSTKIANAAAAGAFGAIVYNNVDEGPIAMAGEGVIPAIGISKAAGLEIIDNLTDATTVSVDGNSPQELPATADLLANFSSRGPTPFTGILKPDLVAPGVNILSSVPGNAFASFNGTSMASPHVAGAAALLVGEHRNWTPAEVKAAIVTGTDMPATLAELSYAERGNGRLNVDRANNVPVLISPPSVSFGYYNQGGRAKTGSVTLDLTAAASTGATCNVSADSGVTLSATTLTVNPAATLTVSLNDTTRRSSDAEGQITFVCGGETLTVGWASYQKPLGKN